MPMVEYSALIDGDAGRVWQVLRRFGEIGAWHPALAGSGIEGDLPEGTVGSVRWLALPDGGLVRERLLSLDDAGRALSYRFEASPMPVDDYVATVRVLPLSDQARALVHWSARFEARAPHPGAEHAQALRDLFAAGHGGLQRLLREGAPGADGAAFSVAHVASVPLEKAYRLLNHGPTVLVSARHGGTDDVMAAAWACALDFAPPKLTVVLDKTTRTRELVEASGAFVIQVPTVALLALTHRVGHRSLHREPGKLAEAGVRLFGIDGHDLPFVEGCSAWLACRLVAEPHNQQAHDLFIGEVVGAWADDRAFREGHWLFESADPAWRSLHYIAGGRFYAIGDAVDA
ncbi:Flavin reductase (DIM6/NTAB) family NADH-FMN oxidoreductase RutF [Paracidovorax anthurii]|uniref:Flavin reductase (DIM6/NTAB) family NADH-FMN oxidoreductase RutF n=1 Tax=Paracidovorax anthurii TaxID=78229 RepID=A0A328ZUE3_9BURK|nr:flavin reductase (DIM6/NTAB) family NADH-FMN oxidoreductase RutF [Paracidovorax anthurii]